MTTSTFELKRLSDRTAVLTVTNAAPGMMLRSSKRHLLHEFGVMNRPRFRMERPYSPDDAWLVEVDPTGALTEDLPSCVLPIASDMDAFFNGQLDDLSHRLVGALPSGRYTIVRSPQTAEAKERVLLGNEYVPAMPNVRVVCKTASFYAALFGADATAEPCMSRLLVGMALLSSTGDDTDDAMWLFDFHGTAAATAPSGGLSVVLPLDSPLVIDAMLTFRGDDAREVREVRERWAIERGPAFARWLAGESEAI